MIINYLYLGLSNTSRSALPPAIAMVLLAKDREFLADEDEDMEMTMKMTGSGFQQ